MYNNPAVPPRAIVQEVQNRVMSTPGTSSGLAVLPKAKSVARMVQRMKEAEWGPEGNLPTCWMDMVIPDQYQKTTSGEDFVLLEESLEPQKIGKIWMFASPFSISILKNSEEWFLDGTFQIVKLTLFAQLYVVVARAPRSNLKRERLERYKKLRAILWSYGEIPIKDYIDALMSLYNDIGVE